MSRGSVGGGSSLLPVFMHAGNLCPPAFPAATGGGLKGFTRRMLKFRQLIDIQSTSSQYMDLIVEPRRVYRMVEFRRQTKGHDSRDDPGLVLVLLYFLLMYGVAMCTAFRSPKSKFLFGMLFYCVVFMVSGIAMATFTYTVARSLLVRVNLFSTNGYRQGAAGGAQPSAYSDRITTVGGAAGAAAHNNNNVASRGNSTAGTTGGGKGGEGGGGSSSRGSGVEWMYCFDIHCNACVPLFSVSFVLQYVFMPILIQPSLTPCVLANCLWCVGSCAYVYITSLGFARLPYLKNTEKFMYPLPVVLLGSVVLTLFGVNMTRTTVNLFLKLFS